MPRLSLYRPNRQNDYKFIDRTVMEMYQVGGVDMFVHKYLGPQVTGDDSSSVSGGTQDATQPAYSSESPLFIEDLFLLENRDRKYDDDVYQMRGVYNAQDIDFDLSQFGLFLNNDTLFITFHYNFMIDTIGRKLMSGDVLELPNLKDFNPLDSGIARAIPKYYVIQDAAFASEGFSQTWLPHLWRVKATPLVSAQEYNDILNKPFEVENIWDNGNYYPKGSIVLAGDSYYEAIADVDPGIDITSTAHWKEFTPKSEIETFGTVTKDREINDAILQQAEYEVPLSGYDTVKFYIVPTNEDGTPADPNSYTVDNNGITVDSTNINVDGQPQSPNANGYTLGYLTGDGLAPNGLPVTPGISFPTNAQEGDFALRLDYYPNRLFRYSGTRWIKYEDDVRTNLTPGDITKTITGYGNVQSQTQRSSFVNNTNQTQTEDRGNIPERQPLSKLLKPQADN
jgi:hypothetical protein